MACRRHGVDASETLHSTSGILNQSPDCDRRYYRLRSSPCSDRGDHRSDRAATHVAFEVGRGPAVTGAAAKLLPHGPRPNRIQRPVHSQLNSSSTSSLVNFFMNPTSVVITPDTSCFFFSCRESTFSSTVSFVTNLYEKTCFV